MFLVNPCHFSEIQYLNYLPILIFLSFSEVKQKNEGGWEFKWDEETRNSFISLEVII